MLLHLAIENYRSIRERATFEMTAGLQRIMRERLPWIKPIYNQRVCPVAAVFGANASGKTTLVRALETLRKLVFSSVSSSAGQLDYHPFLLNKESTKAPTTFEVLFSQNDVIYEYIVKYTAEKVVFEQLTRLYSSTEKVLYTRTETNIEAASFLTEGTGLAQILSVVPETQTLANYLGTINLKRITGLEEHIPMLQSVANFGLSIIVNSDVQFQEAAIFSAIFTEWRQLIPQIDAGISGVTDTEIDPASVRLGAPHFEDGSPEETVTEQGRFRIVQTVDGPRVYKVELNHKTDSGSMPLPWALESEGTKTVVELLAMFRYLTQKRIPIVLVIDELDKSFHTELSRALIDGFLQLCDENTRSQLIFTTHDLLLMDPSRLRRDEIWIVDKDSTGATHFTALSEYEGLRYDKDLRRSYLQGRFGGVPNIGPIDFQVEEARED